MKALVAFFLLVAISATAPFWPTGRESSSNGSAAAFAASANTSDRAATFHDADAALAWSANLASPDWEALPLTERESRFARDFPGSIAVFATPEGETVILRQVNQSTRKLHPASDCLRALGYAIAPGPIRRDAESRDWSTFTATRGAEHLLVRERIIDAEGRGWTDLSAWYWSVAFGHTQGPWLATTLILPSPPKNALAP